MLMTATGELGMVWSDNVRLKAGILGSRCDGGLEVAMRNKSISLASSLMGGGV